MSDGARVGLAFPQNAGMQDLTPMPLAMQDLTPMPLTPMPLADLTPMPLDALLFQVKNCP